jgi:glycosyltransferase involved in cell wall biosynthesis
MWGNHIIKKNNMKKFSIVAHSANHFFRIAEFLNKKNALNKIISIYPHFRLKNYRLSKDKIKFLIIPFIIFCLKRFLKIKFSNIFFSNVFNFYAKNYIDVPKENFLIGSSGYCLNIINLAQKKNMKTIVDRACPHINFQKEIILSEIDKLPIKNSKELKLNYFDEKIVDQMLMEYEKCDLISVPSTFTSESFKKYNLEKKLVFNQLTPEKKLTFQNFDFSNEKEFKIFAIGFNFIRKGFYYLIEAMNSLKNENIKLDLRTIIPNYFNLNQLPKNINLIENHLSNNELQDLYNKADLIVLPSVDEGFGMVALEAMSLKKPVLITENVGMKDILIKYLDNYKNYIIKPANINELSNKIYELSTNKSKLKHEGKLFFEASKKYLEKDAFKGYINL